MPKPIAVDYLTEDEVALLKRLLGGMNHRPPFLSMGLSSLQQPTRRVIATSADERAILACVDAMPKALYEIANWRPVVLRAYLAYRTGDEETLQVAMDDLGDLLPDEWKPDLAGEPGAPKGVVSGKA